MTSGIDALNAITDRVLAYRPETAAKPESPEPLYTFYEFFSGGGMARAGLGPLWRCSFANDFDLKKSASYRENWTARGLKTKDVGEIDAKELPGKASLAWASFPCQDLSLAGMGAGLRGERSGTFWPFWRLIQKLKAEKREPSLVVLENVCGTLTSHDGKDFVAIADALAAADYKFGAVILDAVEFVPQSRPRLFIIGASSETPVPVRLTLNGGDQVRHTRALIAAHDRLTGKALEQWVWWNIPVPTARPAKFKELIEDNPTDVSWHTADETKKLLEMMSPINLEKVEKAKRSGRKQIGAIYKRTRFDEKGKKIQRAEVRFDNIAGCLRTSSGGSSRQLIVVVKGNEVRSRLISARETARLMGLPDTYKLPKNYNEAYHLTGDGVVVPVVRHLAASVLEPVLAAGAVKSRARA